jgi:predicted O-linked N-acetylglucosamine transferase (SPINDLY family)
MASDDRRRIAERTPTRAESGLPETAFVFCSFNNSFKLNPAVFDIWMRILQRVKGSVLWLSKPSEASVADRLRQEARQRGVDPARLVFAERLPLNDDHLARLRLADLFLDTLPYNAHTTANDALWAGLPVLTCLGDTFAGRVAASLLHAMKLQELVTETLDDYEALAVKIAMEPQQLTAIKRKLAESRLTAPLFDTTRFTRNIEAGYAEMFKRHQAGLKPDHISVADS